VSGRFVRLLSGTCFCTSDYRYIELLADHGLAQACHWLPSLIGRINVMNGKLSCKAVAVVQLVAMARPPS